MARAENFAPDSVWEMRKAARPDEETHGTGEGLPTCADPRSCGAFLGGLEYSPCFAPRALAPLTVDGGTRFRVDEYDPDGMSKAFASLVELLRENARLDRDSRRADLRDGCVTLPIREAAAGVSLPVSADVRVSGSKAHVLTFHVPGCVWVRVNVDAGIVEMQLKARQLWAAGYAAAASYWLRQWSRLLMSARIGPDRMLDSCVGAGASVARSLGWRMTGLELCADFQGVAFDRSDLANFVGANKGGEQRRRKVIGDVEQSIGDKHEDSATLTIGTRASPVSLCIYPKTTQIEEAKGGDDSTYIAAWRSSGEFMPAAPVRRVEARLSGVGLRLADFDGEEGSGECFDFRDPATAANPEALAAAWAYATGAKRLTVGGRTRLHRAPTDPRWTFVRGVVPEPERWDAVRQDRSVQEDTHARAMERAARSALRSCLRLAALAGVLPQLGDDVERALSFGMAMARERLGADGFERAGLASYAADYRARWWALLAPEIEAEAHRRGTYVEPDPRQGSAPEMPPKVHPFKG